MRPIHWIAIPFTLTLTLVCTGCIVPDDAPADPGTPNTPAHLSSCNADSGAVTFINGAEITGNSLQVDVEYGGGCAEHELVLCWPGQSFAESDPVQVWLEIWHHDNGDLCQALVSETLSFDLTPLADAWRDGYRNSAGTMILHLGDESLNYSF